jgi:hypothetical protein
MPFNPTAPNAALYGVFPQAYAQSLASPTGDPTADAINRLNLGQHARGSGGVGSYEDLIRQANMMGYSAEMGDQQTRRDVAYLGAVPNMVKVAAGGAVGPGADTGLQIDPTALRQADAAQAQAQQAENIQRIGTAIDAAAGGDFKFNDQYLAAALTNPWSNVIAPAPSKHVTTENQADMKRAENDAVKAQAAMVNARKPSSSGEGNTQTETNQVWDPAKKAWVTIGRTVKQKGGGGQAPAEAKDDDDAPVKKRERKYLTDENGKVTRNPKYKGD